MGKKVIPKGKNIPEEVKIEEKNYDISFLDEDCVQEIIEQLKFLIEKQTKLVILIIHYDIPLGEYKLTSSVKFFFEYLKKQMESTQISFNENSTLIENFDEKIETEFFPENSILVLENAFFQPEEIQFKFDENNALVKYNLDDIQQYVNALSMYCPVFVLDDKDNLFSRYSSVIRIKAENNVLGLNLANYIHQIGHLVSFEKKPFIMFVGGGLSAEKIQGLDVLLEFVDELHLYGEIGMMFYIVQKLDIEKIKLSFLQQWKINSLERNIIKNILLKKKEKIYLPVDFCIIQDLNIEGIEKYSHSWFQKAQETIQNFPPRILKEKQQQEQIQETDDKNTKQIGENSQLIGDNSQLIGENNPQIEQNSPQIGDNDEQNNIQQEEEEEYEEEYDENNPSQKKNSFKNKNYNEIIEDNTIEESFEYNYEAQFPENYLIVDLGEQSLQKYQNKYPKRKKNRMDRQSEYFLGKQCIF
ncbi:phosphoglycerate kinase, putative [Ichthyophthirius multifiliis]|uniref:phosphoglycerate kinase n=1 Tax=Ichthyophthirius multifiliis TaxID=5932 RepID=G0R238_ICHMU|nr:phosphoglycerate kinase, putative [Ichthyophthirius multifiliis]EGR28466.1 phosphoglycerate kinase, putative [Ichthyophthirius multifiliis]|eukprot:XP_004029702.1 phosphoglycerate kinase, putative [Ichthyophthirius multifiliis]